MKTKDRKDIRELAEMMRDLDEDALVLIKHGVTLLADRQRLEQAKKEKVEK